MAKPVSGGPVKRRNPTHNAPLLRKCAVHGKSAKAKRQQDKSHLRREWRFPWDHLPPIENAISKPRWPNGIRQRTSIPPIWGFDSISGRQQRWPFVQRQDTGL